MSAKKGNALLKLLVVLAVIAGGIFATLFFLRETAVVAEVLRGPAVDAVPANVEILADKGLQELKIEGAGRVDKTELDVSLKFKLNEVLLELDTSDLNRRWEERQRALNAEKEKIEAGNKNNERVKVAQDAWENAKRLLLLKRVSDEAVKAAERTYNDAVNQNKLVELSLKKITDDLAADEKAYEVDRKKMSVTAPMDGEVVGVMVAPGALVNGGATVATFYPTKRVVLAKVSEEDFAKVKLNDLAVVQLISVPNKKFEAKVVKIIPFADAETRRFTLHLEVQADEAFLRPNATGEATITTDKRDNVPLVPRRALGPGNAVYVVKNNRVEKRTVEVGFRSLNMAEITKGLEVGETVIVESLDQFRDGQQVKVELVKW